MKKYAPLAFALILAASNAIAAEKGFTIKASEINWQDGKKAQRQLIHKSDDCQVVTWQVKIAPNAELPPHGHDKGYRLVTVISGVLQVGFGKKFDAENMTTLIAGGAFSEPAGVYHFARTGSSGAILNLTEYQVDDKCGK